MIIDTHTHIESDKYTAKDLLNSMDNAGIDYAMLIADSTPLTNGSTNEQVIKICEENPRLKAIANVKCATFDKAQMDTLVGYLKEGKVYGLKFYPGYDDFFPYDEKLFPLYEACQKMGKPVIFHTGFLQEGLKGKLRQSHPLNLDDVANVFPELKIVMAHFGNPWITDAMMVLFKNKNVYADLSGYFEGYKPIPQKHVRYFTHDVTFIKNFLGNYKRFLFATDYPLYSQKEYLDAVKKLSLSSEEKELVFWKNAKEIFGLEI